MLAKERGRRDAPHKNEHRYVQDGEDNTHKTRLV